METKEFIYNKYGIIDSGQEIIEIPNMNRDNLAYLFFELGFTRGVEIGVKQGEYSEVLCKNNPDLYLDSIDCWKTYEDSIYGSQEDLSNWYEETKKRLNKYLKCRVVRNFSVPASTEYDDGELDFVYIDANHRYRFIWEDLEAWDSKVRSGGLISGHDFLFSANCKVGKAVLEYSKRYKIRPVFVVGRKNRIKGENHDASRSWFMIKD